jgi:hypothetical protein
MEEYTQEEQAIIQSFRKLRQSRQKAVTETQSAFEKWLKEDLPNIWNSIKNFITDAWNAIRDFFSS